MAHRLNPAHGALSSRPRCYLQVSELTYMPHMTHTGLAPCTACSTSPGHVQHVVPALASLGHVLYAWTGQGCTLDSESRDGAVPFIQSMDWPCITHLVHRARGILHL